MSIHTTLPDLSRVQSGWASPEAVDEMSAAITTLRAAGLGTGMFAGRA